MLWTWHESKIPDISGEIMTYGNPVHIAPNEEASRYDKQLYFDRTFGDKYIHNFRITSNEHTKIQDLCLYCIRVQLGPD